MSSAETASLLQSLRSVMNKTLFKIEPITQTHYFDVRLPRTKLNFSILYDGLVNQLKWSAKDCAKLIEDSIKANFEVDRAIGVLVGNCLGDAVGAHMEFIPIDSSLPPYHLKTRRTEEGRIAFCDPTQLHPNTESGPRLFYPDYSNKFDLHQGQWTDDFSMALCLADNMLVNGNYEGGDCRARYYNWWYFGYNNAFRFDPDEHRTSVGLGGNISKSIDDLWRYVGRGGKELPANFEAKGEDAGNGSIMRLGAVPIRYNTNLKLAADMAKKSSYATHPGPDAAACCQFMTYFCIKAIHRPMNDNSTTVQSFIDATIVDFLKDHTADEIAKKDSGFTKLSALLQGTPPSPTEACWNWKLQHLPLEETIKNRGHKYNGYPVNSGYFGSYCMDGLAMALWGLYASQNFADCILKVVNLLGDCDTTAAIAGQMAGAFYGYSSLFQDPPSGVPPFGQVMMGNMRKWDPMYEIELRALLLYDDSRSDTDDVKQSDQNSEPTTATSVTKNDEGEKEEEKVAEKKAEETSE